MVCRIVLWASIALGFALNASGQSREENAFQCESNDADASISGCTALIQSGPELTLNLALIYYNRGNAYKDKGQFDRAIQDYDEAIRLDPEYANSFNNRGYAYNAKRQHDRAIMDFNEAIRLNPKLVNAFIDRGYSYGSNGQYERAIQDFDEAIRLDPKNKTAFNNRGYVYAAKGQYRRAIQDYDEAIKLDPKLAIAFLNRGHASFYGLRFASAVTDLERYNEVDPSEAYTVLWLHLAKKHLGQEDSEDLKQSAAKVDQSKWPAPILRFYMGQIKAKQVLAAAASPDAEKQKGQLCEADFYTGEDALLHQRWFLPWRRTSGKARLRAARDACPRDYIEYVGAMVELKRISGATVPAD